jgi:hypothetical protein
MSTVRPILATLLLVGLLLLTSGSVTAKEGGPGKGSGKPSKARITWSTPLIEQAVSPGQSVDVTVTLTSSADLTNVTLQVPGSLHRIVAIEPTSIASLKAGVATPVKLTISMPATGAHNQGGVVQVRAGQRNVPAGLHIKLTVPGTSDEDGAENGE